MRSFRSLASFVLACAWLGCARAPVLVQAEERPALGARIEAPAREKVGPFVPSNATPGAVVPLPAGPNKQEWEDPPFDTPPSDVKCVLRGSSLPFPSDSCESPWITVLSASGAPLMRLAMFQLPVVWGIRGRGERAWIHAREEEFAVTGFASLDDVKLHLLEKTPLLADHVWARADAPVQIQGATASGALTVSVVDLPGIDKLRVDVPCDGVSFDPADPTPLVPPPLSQEERVWPRGDALTLRGSPGGPSILEVSKLARLGVDLEVRERRDGATRITFETRATQIDAWVKETDLSPWPRREHHIGRSCRDSGGKVSGGGQVRVATVLESVWSRVGVSPERGAPAVRIGVGAKMSVGEVRGGFVECLYTARLRMVGDNRLWIPREALGAIEVIKD